MDILLVVIASTSPFLCAVLFIIYNMVQENTYIDPKEEDTGTYLEPLLNRYNK